MHPAGARPKGWGEPVHGLSIPDFHINVAPLQEFSLSAWAHARGSHEGHVDGQQFPDDPGTGSAPIQDELGCVLHHGFQLFVAELSPAVTVYPSVLGQWAGILREIAPLNGFIKHLVQRSIVVVLGTAREFAPHPLSPPHVEL